MAQTTPEPIKKAEPQKRDPEVRGPKERPDKSGKEKVDASGKDKGPAKEKLGATNSDRAQRATGKTESKTLAQRATGDKSTTNSHASKAEDKAHDIKDSRENEQGPLKKDSEAQPQAGERASEWVNSDSDWEAEFDYQFGKGCGDFVRNYQEMKQKNTKGADKYYHCKANCEATSRGPGGEAAAKTISYGREATDTVTNTTFKGMSLKDSLADSRADMHANRVGQEAGARGLRCADACHRFRPRGL